MRRLALLILALCIPMLSMEGRGLGLEPSVARASGTVAVTGGLAHTCALSSAGTVSCWGANWFGQLGDGTTTTRLTPIQLSLTDVDAVSAGNTHTCAVTASGGVKCWGDIISANLEIPPQWTLGSCLLMFPAFPRAFLTSPLGAQPPW